jgi:quercetin dioxygenase-like cupin family protein
MGRNRLRWCVSFLVLICSAAAVEGQKARPAATASVPLETLCGPQAVLALPVTPFRIAGGTERVKSMFSAGDTVIVNAGSRHGVEAGQHFFARRVVVDRFAAGSGKTQPHSIHTAGWLTIVKVDEHRSTATIVETCDGIVEGDYLEPLVLPVSASVPAGAPDFERPGLVILGDERRQLGGEGSVMVIDRGTDHGVVNGQHLTVFRHAIDAAGPVVTIGTAVVVSTRPDTSLMRISKSREAIQVGDLVAIHR